MIFFNKDAQYYSTNYRQINKKSCNIINEILKYNKNDFIINKFIVSCENDNLKIAQW